MVAAYTPIPLTVRALLDAGAHFGHQTYHWNPKMKKFIFGERNGVHIVDLDQTLERFQDALEFLRETTAGGWQGALRRHQATGCSAGADGALRASQLFVNNRWLGDAHQLPHREEVLDHFKEQLVLQADEAAERVVEEGRSRISRDVERYRKSLEGLREMTKLPAAMFLVDVKREHIAVAEGRRLGIPIVAVVDTNCDPEGIDFVIPGNDDATRAISLYCGQVADACIDGAQLHEARIRSEAVEEATGRRAEGEAHTTGMGRVVVEIKQPPRRGRGARRGGTRSAVPTPRRPSDDGRSDERRLARPAPASASPAGGRAAASRAQSRAGRCAAACDVPTKETSSGRDFGCSGQGPARADRRRHDGMQEGAHRSERRCGEGGDAAPRARSRQGGEARRSGEQRGHGRDCAGGRRRRDH
jgi:small subunit ribosomal protein S2